MSTLYTLDEAAKLTGLTTEALRKRFLRGQIEGIGSKESNDGKVRLRLTEGQLADLRKPDDEPDDRPDTPTQSASPEVSMARLIDSLEVRTARAEASADREREAADAARAARDQAIAAHDVERREWRQSLDAVTAELAAVREGRSSDRRIAVAAVRRIRDQSSELKAQLDEVLARQQAAATSTPPITRRWKFWGY